MLSAGIDESAGTGTDSGAAGGEGGRELRPVSGVVEDAAGTGAVGSVVSGLATSWPCEEADERAGTESGIATG